MTLLTTLPWWLLVPIALLVVGGVSLLLRALLDRLLGASRTQAASFAAPLMPALGVLFAFLSGFAITAMWSAHTTAEANVSREATASEQLAWAATADHVDTAAIQSALLAHLDAVLDTEWPRQDDATPNLVRPSTELTHLEQLVRSSASDPSIGQADAAAMIAAVDQLSIQRSARFGSAKSSMPLPLFVALVVSGLALCVNSLIVAMAGDSRSRRVTFSILMVVAIDLAVLLILAGPFSGSQRVSNAPLVEVRDLIASGSITAGPIAR